MDNNLEKIFLDNNLQTKPSEGVLEAMQKVQEKFYASCAAPYHLGDEALAFVNEKTQGIYEIVDANDEDTMIFCQSGIDALEKVFLNFIMGKTLNQKPLNIVSIDGESSFLSFYLDNLEKTDSINVHKIPVDGLGKINIDQLAKVLNEKLIDLVSLSYANGLTGVIQPIEEITKLCQEKNVFLHVDASYVIGKIYFSLKDLAIDYLTFSTSLTHGPKNAAALFVKAKNEIHPWISGGEKDAFLAHKMDVASFAGFAKSCEETKAHLEAFSFETASVTLAFEEAIKANIKHVSFPLKKADRLPNVSIIVFEGIPSEPFLYHLNEANLFATFGRGFSSHLANILQLTGYDKKNSWSALSFTLSRETTEKEITQAVEIILKTYEKVKRDFCIS